MNLKSAVQASNEIEEIMNSIVESAKKFKQHKKAVVGAVAKNINKISNDLLIASSENENVQGDLLSLQYQEAKIPTALQQKANELASEVNRLSVVKSAQERVAMFALPELQAELSRLQMAVGEADTHLYNTKTTLILYPSAKLKSELETRTKAYEQAKQDLRDFEEVFTNVKALLKGRSVQPKADGVTVTLATELINESAKSYAKITKLRQTISDALQVNTDAIDKLKEERNQLQDLYSATSPHHMCGYLIEPASVVFPDVVNVESIANKIRMLAYDK